MSLPHEPDIRETLRDSPLLRNLCLLPQEGEFESITEWADKYANRFGIHLEKLEKPFVINDTYVYSYMIRKHSGFVFFGSLKNNPKKFVIGKRPLLPHEYLVDEDIALCDHCITAAQGEFSALEESDDDPYVNQLLDTAEISDTWFEMADSTPHRVTKKAPFLVIEFIIPGIDLRFFISHLFKDANEIQRADFAAAVGLQIARALKRIHSENILHNDIDLKNIMLRNPLRNCGFAVLSDFNSAVDKNARETEQEIRQLPIRTTYTVVPPELVLTPEEINPPKNVITTELNTPATNDGQTDPPQEHSNDDHDSDETITNEENPTEPEIEIGGEAALTLKSDYYSLGCTMFALCTGHYPYPGSTLQEVREQMLSNGEDHPRKILEALHVPKAITSIICKLLRFDAHNRYRNLPSLEKALRSLVTHTEYAQYVGEAIDDPHDNGTVDKLRAHIAGQYKSPLDTLHSKDGSSDISVKPVTVKQLGGGATRESGLGECTLTLDLEVDPDFSDQIPLLDSNGNPITPSKIRDRKTTETAAPTPKNTQNEDDK